MKNPLLRLVLTVGVAFPLGAADGANQVADLTQPEKSTLRVVVDREGYRRVMISEPDNGMYDAVNKGLKRGSGRIWCLS